MGVIEAGTGVLVGVAETAGSADTEILGVTEGVGVGVRVAVTAGREALGLGVGDTCVAAGVAVRVEDGAGVADVPGVRDGVRDGVTVTLGVLDGVRVRVTVGLGVMLRVVDGVGGGVGASDESEISNSSTPTPTSV